MKHLDLFSGIGGFALAIDRVWEGVEHTFCEIDPFCVEVLKKHWPNSKIYGDIRTLTNSPSIGLEEQGLRHNNQQFTKQNKRDWDLLTGGFPCQPFSQAGRRKGTADDRHLWPEMLRVIREFHPSWVIGENVGGFVTWNDGLVLEQVHTDLEGEGYEVQSFIIPAVAKNAPHRRDRVWIVGHAKHDGLDGPKNSEGNHKRSDTRQEKSNDFQQSKRPDSKRIFSQRSWDTHWLEVATRLCRVDDGLPRRLDRNPRLKALGNAIVPQVAEEIMKAIKSSQV